MNAVTQQPETQPAQATEERFVPPVVNIYETPEGYTLEAEMPGVTKEGLEITVEGNEITIVGRREPDPLQAEVLYRETQPFNYRRVFEVDPQIDTSRITAKMDQGVLTLFLPKTEQVKPRKISIE